MVPLPDPIPLETSDNSDDDNDDGVFGRVYSGYFDAEPAETRSLSCIDALKHTAGIPQEYPTTNAGPEIFSLRNCVLSIPSTKETPPTTEVLKSRPEDKLTPSLALLPEKAVEIALKMCDSESLQAAASTCKFLRHLAPR
jgi:hypothetical protein